MSENISTITESLPGVSPLSNKAIDPNQVRLFQQAQLLIQAGEETQEPLDLSGRDLRNENLKDKDLRGANLSSANLNGVDLSLQDLTGANLQGADLHRANLSGANLTDADLTKGILINADLSGANLTGAKLIKANLFKTDFSSANITNTNFTEAYLLYAFLNAAKIIGADFSDAWLKEVDLSEASLSAVNFNRANFTGSSLLNADLSRASLDEAILEGVILDGANLREASLRSVKAKGASWLGANLSEANLESATLSKGNFSRANLTRANLQYAALHTVVANKANFHKANLGSAEMYSAYLPGADLSGAEVKWAKFDNAVLWGADLRTNLGDAGSLAGVYGAGAILPLGTHKPSVLAILTNGGPVRINFAPENLNVSQQNSPIFLRGSEAISNGPNEYIKKHPVLSQRLIDGNLSQADLSGLNLVGADLSGQNLEQANLSGADLTNANLSGANLYGANLSNATLDLADLSRANLDLANLTGAKLLGADFSSARGRRATMVEVSVNSTTNFMAANFTGSDWGRAWLMEANMHGLNLQGAMFKNTALQGANLSWAILHNANFESAFLQGTDFSHTLLREADFSGAVIDEETDFRNAVLSTAILKGLDLSDVPLSGAMLVGADLSETILGGNNLSYLNLFDAKLNGAQLAGVNLSNANLSSAYFREANLQNVIATNANLTEATFNGANLKGAAVKGAIFEATNLSGVNLVSTHISPQQLAQAGPQNLEGITIDRTTFNRIRGGDALTWGVKNWAARKTHIESGKNDPDYMKQFTISYSLFLGGGTGGMLAMSGLLPIAGALLVPGIGGSMLYALIKMGVPLSKDQAVNAIKLLGLSEADLNTLSSIKVVDDPLSLDASEESEVVSQNTLEQGADDGSSGPTTDSLAGTDAQASQSVADQHQPETQKLFSTEDQQKQNTGYTQIRTGVEPKKQGPGLVNQTVDITGSVQTAKPFDQASPETGAQQRLGEKPAAPEIKPSTIVVGNQPVETAQPPKDQALRITFDALHPGVRGDMTFETFAKLDPNTIDLLVTRSKQAAVQDATIDMHNQKAEIARRLTGDLDAVTQAQQQLTEQTLQRVQANRTQAKQSFEVVSLKSKYPAAQMIRDGSGVAGQVQNNIVSTNLSGAGSVQQAGNTVNVNAGNIPMISLHGKQGSVANSYTQTDSIPQYLLRNTQDGVQLHAVIEKPNGELAFMKVTGINIPVNTEPTHFSTARNSWINLPQLTPSQMNGINRYIQTAQQTQVIPTAPAVNGAPAPGGVSVPSVPMP